MVSLSPLSLPHQHQVSAAILDHMGTRRAPSRRCGGVLLLAAIAAVLVGLLGAGTASAATLPGLETRAAASIPGCIVVVGPHEYIAVGQHLGGGSAACRKGGGLRGCSRGRGCDGPGRAHPLRRSDPILRSPRTRCDAEQRHRDAERPANSFTTAHVRSSASLSLVGIAAKTTTGGAEAVRVGQAGEAAVRSAFDIGPKATRVIGGRTRIFDGLTDSAVSEVKNVGYQAYTQQLKDSLSYAQANGLEFNLYVRRKPDDSVRPASGCDCQHPWLQSEVHPMTGRRRQAMSATEFAAQLEKDQEYQQQKAAYEAGVRERANVLRTAEQPIVAALRLAGVDVSSVWDLVNTSVPYPQALPVLMDHLERGGYPDRVMESLGRALAVKPSVAYWDRLKARYLAPRGPGEEDGAAVALAAAATAAQLDDLIGFLGVIDRGESRIYFVRPILRVGGSRGRQVVEELRTDPVFGKEAAALLAGGE